MPSREPFDMGFVDNGFMPGDLQSAIAIPFEVGLVHDTMRDKGRAVPIAAYVGAFIEAIGKNRFMPLDLAFNCFRIGVEQQFVGVATLPVGGFPRSMSAKTIALSGFDGG